LVVALFFVPFLSAGSSFAQELVVDSRLDERDAFPGDGRCASAAGRCTLRAAIEENERSGPYLVTVPAGVFRLRLGDLDINSALTLSGAGSDSTIIDGRGAHRVFEIGSEAFAYIEKVTVRNGRGGPSTVLAGHIHGGGIHNHGDLILVDSSVIASVAETGGGITNAGTGFLQLVNVTVSDNAACTHGGGIENLGELELVNVTISHNTGLESGGLYSQGEATLWNTLIANNVTRNCAGTGRNGSVRAGEIISAGNNLEADHNINWTCPFLQASDMVRTTAKLEALHDSAGFAYLYALQPGSPAIDRGNNDTCSSSDQRGVVRPAEGDNVVPARCDIGAFEYVPPVSTPPVDTISK
jgi:hypothetical protein